MGLSHDRGGKSKQIVAQIAGSAILAVHTCAETAQSIIPRLQTPSASAVAIYIEERAGIDDGHGQNGNISGIGRVGIWKHHAIGAIPFLNIMQKGCVPVVLLSFYSIC